MSIISEGSVTHLNGVPSYYIEMIDIFVLASVTVENIPPAAKLYTWYVLAYNRTPNYTTLTGDWCVEMELLIECKF